MDRRRFVAGMGMALAVPLARAQKASDLPVAGVLTPHPPFPPDHPNARAIREKYRQLGWVADENLRFERPNAEGREDRLPALAEELVQKRVNVILAIGPEAALAAARATRSIPIVFWGVAYPVEQGLVDSYARPGRNVTGVAFSAGHEGQKVLETLREIAPKAARLAHVATPTAMRTVSGEIYTGALPGFLGAAEKLGFESRRFEVARVEDFDAAFAAIVGWRAQAIVVPGSTLTFRERQRFVDFANANRLPSGFNQGEFVASGGLLSYGIQSMQTVLQSHEYVDRILRGAKAAELPVQLPRTFELLLNARTAKSIGLAIPRSLLLRADRVIE